MIDKLLISLVFSIAICGFDVGATEVGDVSRGLKVFKKCTSCHAISPDARKRVGPALINIVNAPAGQVGEYKYSKALRAAAANGLHWTPEALDLFLKKPKAFLPKTKMSFRGLKKPADRTDVIAYLATFSTVETAAKPGAGFEISADILSIAGDIEYGEYLSSECTTCHQMNGESDTIPNITGRPVDDFVTAMHAYREKYRSHPVMQMISGRLSNDEIAALAAYYSSLKK